MDLRERVKKFHEIENIKYKDIAKELKIPISSMYNFTSEIRRLKPSLAKLLDVYLKEKGY